jgi:hypothetical protein
MPFIQQVCGTVNVTGNFNFITFSSLRSGKGLGKMVPGIAALIKKNSGIHMNEVELQTCNKIGNVCTA